MTKLAKLENNEIVIRINVSNVNRLMEPTFAYLYGPDHGVSINDTRLFIEEFIDALNEEDFEDGNTPITSMLDNATISLVDKRPKSLTIKNYASYYELGS